MEEFETLLQTIINAVNTKDSAVVNAADVNFDKRAENGDNGVDEDYFLMRTNSESESESELEDPEEDCKIQEEEVMEREEREDDEKVNFGGKGTGKGKGKGKGKVQMRIFHEQEFTSIFSKFLEVSEAAGSDPILSEKLKKLSPHITTSASLSLYTALKEFLCKLIAEIGLISQEFSDLKQKCTQIYRKRRITLDNLSKDCKKLKELKRQSQDIFEENNLEFDIEDENEQEQEQEQEIDKDSMLLIIKTAIKRLKLDQISISENFINIINSTSDSSESSSEEDVVDEEQVDEDEESGSTPYSPSEVSES